MSNKEKKLFSIIFFLIKSRIITNDLIISECVLKMMGPFCKEITHYAADISIFLGHTTER